MGTGGADITEQAVTSLYGTSVITLMASFLRSILRRPHAFETAELLQRDPTP